MYVCMYVCLYELHDAVGQTTMSPDYNDGWEKTTGSTVYCAVASRTRYLYYNGQMPGNHGL